MRLIFVLLFLCLSIQLSAENRIHYTGYFAINGEYIYNLPIMEELNKQYGVNISEASLLTQYRIKDDINIFSVFTYKPDDDLNSMLVELSADYKIRDYFKIKAGRFILPINPINAQYYATMNTGIAHPSFVTNHKLFPLNMNGINLNGNIFINNDNSLKYNLIAGSYSQSYQSKEGVTGFLGREGVFMEENTDDVLEKIARFDSLENTEKPLHIAAGGNLSYNYDDFVNLGFGALHRVENVSTITKTGVLKDSDINLFSYGMDLSLNYYDFNLRTSIWFGKEKFTSDELFRDKNYHIYSGELSYTFLDYYTPYFKMESISGMEKDDRERFIYGINFRPSYEITLKLEDILYVQKDFSNFHVLHFSLIYSF
jgi:hypothetical protein